ncbi:MAG: hypothetical protein PWQ28_523 [Candidatus Woesearchaeota archaeon]|nr:hypothetical protein [Candidatus Woesearchaeota archaeon]
MKYVIKGIENIDDIHRYIIKKDKNIHNAFCNLLSEFNFGEDNINKVDTIFDDLDNEFFYVTNNELDVYFFITKEYVNLVIKTSIPQNELNKSIRKYFSFPGL